MQDGKVLYVEYFLGLKGFDDDAAPVELRSSPCLVVRLFQGLLLVYFVLALASDIQCTAIADPVARYLPYLAGATETAG